MSLADLPLHADLGSTVPATPAQGCGGAGVGRVSGRGRPPLPPTASWSMCSPGSRRRLCPSAPAASFASGWWEEAMRGSQRDRTHALRVARETSGGSEVQPGSRLKQSLHLSATLKTISGSGPTSSMSLHQPPPCEPPAKQPPGPDEDIARMLIPSSEVSRVPTSQPSASSSTSAPPAGFRDSFTEIVEERLAERLRADSRSGTAGAVAATFLEVPVILTPRHAHAPVPANDVYRVPATALELLEDDAPPARAATSPIRRRQVQEAVRATTSPVRPRNGTDAGLKEAEAAAVREREAAEHARQALSLDLRALQKLAEEAKEAAAAARRESDRKSAELKLREEGLRQEQALWHAHTRAAVVTAERQQRSALEGDADEGWRSVVCRAAAAAADVAASVAAKHAAASAAQPAPEPPPEPVVEPVVELAPTPAPDAAAAAEVAAMRADVAQARAVADADVKAAATQAAHAKAEAAADVQAAATEAARARAEAAADVQAAATEAALAKAEAAAEAKAAAAAEERAATERAAAEQALRRAAEETAAVHRALDIAAASRDELDRAHRQREQLLTRRTEEVEAERAEAAADADTRRKEAEALLLAAQRERAEALAVAGQAEEDRRAAQADRAAAADEAARTAAALRAIESPATALTAEHARRQAEMLQRSSDLTRARVDVAEQERALQQEVLASGLLPGHVWADQRRATLSRSKPGALDTVVEEATRAAVLAQTAGVLAGQQAEAARRRAEEAEAAAAALQSPQHRGRARPDARTRARQPRQGRRQGYWRQFLREWEREAAKRMVSDPSEPAGVGR